jgi:hypothetical protein
MDDTVWVDPHELDSYSRSEYVYLKVDDSTELYMKAEALRRLVQLAELDETRHIEGGILIPKAWLVGIRVGY